MANDTIIAVRGWAGSDPVLYQNRDLETGRDTHISSATISVGVTARNYSRHSNKFEDGETTWYSVRCFGMLAQNVALTVRKGAPLLVRGRFTARRYTDKDGIDRTSQQILADSVAIDLNNMVATYMKPSAHGGENTSVIRKGNECSSGVFYADALGAPAADNSEKNAGVESAVEKKINELASVGV